MQLQQNRFLREVACKNTRIMYLKSAQKYKLCRMLTGRGCFSTGIKITTENEEIYRTSVSGKVGMDSKSAS